MANRVFQSVIYQMKDAIDRVVGVVDETGAVISCSELNLIGEVREGFMAERLTAGDRFVRDGYTYQQFSSAKHNDYAVFVEGADETAGQFAAVLSISLQSIKQYHDEKFDKSNFIKNVVYQMKDAVDRVVGVIDETGTVISCSELGQIGEVREGVATVRQTAGDAFVRDGYAYHQFSNAKHNDYAVFVEGTDTTAEQFAAMLSISLQSIKQYHDEKFDKTNFIKNVVLDNILPGDIYAKARELHFVSDVQRVVLLIRVTSGNDISAYDVVSGLFPDKQKDFVFNISETDTVLVKEIKPDNNTREMEKLAASIVDTLQGDHYIKAVVGIGTPIGNIKDLASSFKEAQIAMEVGKVFDTERQVISYDHLGIARLIYQLPTTVCEMFLREVFKQGSIESLDQETLFTIQRFFENNLNVSETSRGLFVHRNTLVYRLEKIKKLTGLDLREFDDAIVFKVALMVKKYLSNNPAKY